MTVNLLSCQKTNRALTHASSQSQCRLLQEDDPLDAFMADLNNMDTQLAAPDVANKKRKADVELDEEADNVADFLEVGIHVQ